MSKRKSNNDKEESRLATQLIQGGSEIAGAAIGAALGLIGPVGAVAGAASGAVLSRVLKHVGAELSQRVLGPRESVRIGAVAAFAGARIQLYLESGQQPREDDFFGADNNGRVPAEEILEGVLLKARDAYESKKLQLLGNLYAGIAFDSTVSPSQANHLIFLAGQLTYRQLVGLGIAGLQSKNGPIFSEASYRNNDDAKESLGSGGVALITEIYDLYNRGLISDSKSEAWISLTDVAPGRMQVQGSGSMLYNLMRLWEIDRKDWKEYIEFLTVYTDGHTDSPSPADSPPQHQANLSAPSTNQL